MANLAVKNAADTTVYLSTQGAGTNSDPYIYTGGSMVVSNFPATQAVSAASLPLPSGAATLAKQPALGTAGVSSTDVITVQGIASGTAQPISAASLPLPSGASTALKQPALGTAGTASADVITIQGIASMTAVKVDGSAVTQPTSNATQLPAALGQTTMSASLPVTIASNQSAVPISGTVTANLGSGSQVSVSGAVAVTQSGTWTVQPGNTANSTAWLVSLIPATTGGLSTYRNLDSGSSGVNIKNSAGQLYGYYIYNNASSARFVKIYNTAGTPVYTDTPIMTLPLPAGAAANVSHPSGIAFGTGIGIRSTVLVADTDQTQTTTNDVVVNIYYK